MKRNYALIVITFLCAILSSYGQVSDLIISEYFEGSSSNKYIEIYNGTGSAVDLSDYELWRVANGGSWPEFTISLSGTLADGATYVVANPLSIGAITGAADLLSSGIAHNGDDAVGLAKDIAGTFTLIDAVGTDGADPGSGWDVAGTTNATLDHTLVRKTSTCSPNTNWVTSAGTSVANSEWTVLPLNDFSDIGSHTSICTDTYLSFVIASSSLVESGAFIDICVSILNPSAVATTTVDITLDGASNATNGADYDDGAGSPMAITFPQTLTFPIGSGANECLTIFISNDDLIYEGDETVVLNLSNPTGGISAALSGITQHTLTILDNEIPVIADVIITEIMYNSQGGGGDDEWIEICNTTGISQVLNNYTIEVNNTLEFTFPSSGVVIASGDCITVDLGEVTTDGAYNLQCPFTPDFSNGSGTGTLANSPTLPGWDIEIIASDNTTIVDIVTYNDDTGGDGNGASIHVTDDSLDNSDTDINWQEVIDGGSPGFNTLISQCSPLQPEINVEGEINSFPDISNNDNTPSFFDNTQFSSLELGSPETKSFRIQNIGTADLTVSNIQIIGDADFTLTLPSGLPIVVNDISTMTNVVVFDITFTPAAIGLRTATVRITNDDPTGLENIFEYDISGIGFCTTAVNVLTPLTGPDNTVVTISGSDLDGTTSVEFAGLPIAHTVISPSEIEITIPANSISGSIIVTNNIGCQTTDLFTIIDNTISSCEGSSGLTPTDLFISEITDAPTGSHTYIEIYNGTGAAVDLTDYEIRIHNNGSNNAGGAIADLSGILADDTVYVVAIGGTDVNDPEGGYTADDFFGINGINDDDNIRLYTDDGTTETWIDVWGDTSGSTFTVASSGYTYRRKNTGITVPRTDLWGPADNMQNDWDAISPVDYTDIGLFDFSIGAPPTITLEPIAPVSSCDLTASFTIAANQGFAGGLPLAYQWYVSIPGNAGWSMLTNNATYSGVNTVTLNISNTIGLDNNQYYCQVRENLNTCFTATDAVRLITKSSNWISPGIWDNGTPDINTIAVLDFNYDTTVNGSFSACRLNINSGTLNIRDGDYVEINYDLIVNGTLDIEHEGSLVMIDDTGTVTNNGTTNVHKITTAMETYDYTYWSSPVDYTSPGTAAQTILTGFYPNRIYSFNTSQFFDIQDPDGVPGADGFDDNQNAWTSHYNLMSNGNGYAAMTTGIGVHQRPITFSGTLNTGDITVPVALSLNGADANDDWNLLGNPYPSAIFVDDFVAHNLNLSGTVYLWTHEDDISITNPGPDIYNFNSNDYAMYNSVGGVGTASTGTVVSNVPTGYIASGQGFFIDAISAGNIEFTNAMRDRTHNNNDFFRNSESNSTAYPEKDRMWINMTNSDGAFSQILIGYMEDGTLGKDRLYDGIRLEGSNYIDFYSKDATDLYKYGIQGRPPFTIEDVIPLGYDSGILGGLTISLNETEGILSETTVYLRDNLLNTIHNLTNSDYTFTTEDGSFSDRFEIIYQSEVLSIVENEIDSNGLTIIELQSGSVKFSVVNNLTINSIEIIDLLGRTLYNLKGNNSTEIYDLNNLSQTAYIAKVILSNGQTITKRAIKRK